MKNRGRSNFKRKSRRKFRQNSNYKNQYSQQGSKNQYSRQNSKSNFYPEKTYDPKKPVNLKQIARAAMQKYGFTPDFPNEVLKKANNMDTKTIERQKNQVENLTSLLWSSIDNIDTEDLDQIEYCERRGENIHIKVGIADVDSYVPKDSLLDRHAQKNTTSVYTGVEIYPMFPDILSKNLTSLPPNEDRLAMVAEFDVLPNGEVKPGRVFRALVRNKAKLVYEQVGAWLEGKAQPPKEIEKSKELTGQILLQHEASIKLGKFRAKEGALELQTMQTKAVVKNQKVLGLYVVEDDPAKRIIENFMIGANGAISQMLERSGRPTIQRVVKRPKYWDEIVELAGKHSFRLPKMPDSQALSKFLDKERVQNPKTFPDLSLAIIKLLGRGEYVLYDKRNPIGHFCMAITSYTHSTAPNRRYPDLVIQRLIKSLLDGSQTPYGRDELKYLANRCTELEHAADKVERFVTKAEGAVLLSAHLGEAFDAIVTGASRKGAYARLEEPPVEGKLMGRALRVKVGQQIRVKLINLDPYKGYVDFALVSNL
ncbi:MAG: RNB domain-containing ribonuclease [Candidatus Micrarchaeota archaeon]